MGRPAAELANTFTAAEFAVRSRPTAAPNRGEGESLQATATEPFGTPFRLLAERSQDVIYRVNVAHVATIEYISPASRTMTGYAPEEFYADPGLWQRLIHPDDRAAFAEVTDVYGKSTTAIELPVDVRWVRRDGSILWTEQRSVAVLDEGGQLVAIEGSARDVTARIEGERRLRLSEGRLREFLETIDIGALMVDRDGIVGFINDHLLSLLERSREEVLGQDWIASAVPPNQQDALRAAFVAATHADRVDGRREDDIVTKSGVVRRLRWTSAFQHDDAGNVIGLASIAHDVTTERALEKERDVLVAAVEQAAESIMLTDARGQITYVNAAFERGSGYRRTEVIGENPRLVKSGAQSETFYDAMWAALTNGLPWIADFTNRRRDGSYYNEMSAISPVRDKGGVITNYVSVSRDVTAERQLESRTEALTRERQLITETLARIQPTDALDDVTAVFCRQVTSLDRVCTAAIVVFEPGGISKPIALVATGIPDIARRPLTVERTRYLQERAETGPWVEAWDTASDHAYAGLFRELGVRGFAYSPIRNGSSLVGVLAVGSSEADAIVQLASQLPAVVDFAALAGALLGPAVLGRRETSEIRSELESIVADRAFEPVFQPIVDLTNGMIVGYEALTRFGDGVAPDIRFGAAALVGFGIELEAATLEAAVVAARALPSGRWLNLNVSAELIDSGSELTRILRDGPVRPVLEVTEHAAISDYPAFRHGVEALGRDVLLAVDDAGAGFASLRHILELHPQLIKLDVSLVRDVSIDPTKQALVAGMKQFARATGCRLIAEGVETADEAETLRRLDVRLAQGYWLGRPDRAAHWAARRPPATCRSSLP